MTVSERKNPAREAELQRLIAEQESDDTPYVSQRAHLSLDAPLYEDADGSLYERLTDEQSIDAGPAQPRFGKRSHKVTAEQIKEWRALRNTEHWTYAQIAEYAGVQVKTVQQHISRRSKHKREGIPKVRLLERLDEFQAAYEAGAALREIAEIHYRDLGYGRWESCYQQLRLSLKESGVAIRVRTLKHGMRSANASPEDQRAYRRERSRVERQARLTRCDATVRSGRPCRRWALSGSRYCMVHDERTRSSTSRRRWTQSKVLEALRAWAEAHGRVPRAEDWAKAEDGHPSFGTVVDLFGKWNLGLCEAGLRERTLRERKLDQGYKECAQPGCDNLVAASRYYCRDRRCQDTRSSHGTLTGYKTGCRCDLCTEANTEYQRQYRQAPAVRLHGRKGRHGRSSPVASRVADRSASSTLAPSASDREAA